MTTRRATRAIPSGPDRSQLAAHLKSERSGRLVELVLASFDAMHVAQRREVFDHYLKTRAPKHPDAAWLWKEIQAFDRSSRNGDYYAPFDINSKNFSEVPEETTEWCSRTAELIEQTVAITRAGEHSVAVECFGVLLQLIQDMDNDEIVFADEIGSWMVPVSWNEPWLPEYIKAISAVSTPDRFADLVIPILEFDQLQSNTGKAYKSVYGIASENQAKKLRSEIKRRQVRLAENE